MAYLPWFLVALFSAAFQTVSGFGYAVLMVAVLPLFGNDVQLVATVMTLSAFGVAGYSFIKYIKKVRFDLFFPVFSAFLVLEALTARIAVGLDQQKAFVILGIILILISVISLVKKGGLHYKHKALAGVLLGSLGGASAGFFAVGGPPMAVYYIGCTDDKEEYLSSLAFTFICSGLSNVVIRAAQGLINITIVDELAVSLAGLAVGCLVGRSIVKKISDASFLKITYIFISLLGVWYIVRGFV